jgi:hypothetical protein
MRGEVWQFFAMNMWEVTNEAGVAERSNRKNYAIKGIVIENITLLKEGCN